MIYFLFQVKWRASWSWLAWVTTAWNKVGLALGPVEFQIWADLKSIRPIKLKDKFDSELARQNQARVNTEKKYITCASHGGEKSRPTRGRQSLLTFSIEMFILLAQLSLERTLLKIWNPKISNKSASLTKFRSRESVPQIAIVYLRLIKSTQHDREEPGFVRSESDEQQYV